jgi:DNA-directed RNA polymerase specialized sigma24 family protein
MLVVEGCVSNKEILLSIEDIDRIIKRVVNRLTYQNKIPAKEKEDICQDLIHKYLAKKSRIEGSFQGKSKYETYLTSVFYKMTCEIIRNESKNWHYYEHTDNEMPFFETRKAVDQEHYLLKSEFDFLMKTLELFADEKLKVIVFLKYFYKIIIKEDELKDFCRNYKELEIDQILLAVINNNQQAFENLAIVVNLIEKKQIKADAVRIWLYNKIDRIIKILNNTHQKSNYDRKSFQLLFEYAFTT